MNNLHQQLRINASLDICQDETYMLVNPMMVHTMTEFQPCKYANGSFVYFEEHDDLITGTLQPVDHRAIANARALALLEMSDDILLQLECSNDILKVNPEELSVTNLSVLTAQLAEGVVSVAEEKDFNVELENFNVVDDVESFDVPRRYFDESVRKFPFFKNDRGKWLLKLRRLTDIVKHDDELDKRYFCREDLKLISERSNVLLDRLDSYRFNARALYSMFCVAYRYHENMLDEMEVLLIKRIIVHIWNAIIYYLNYGIDRFLYKYRFDFLVEEGLFFLWEHSLLHFCLIDQTFYSYDRQISLKRLQSCFRDYHHQGILKDIFFVSPFSFKLRVFFLCKQFYIEMKKTVDVANMSYEDYKSYKDEGPDMCIHVNPYNDQVGCDMCMIELAHIRSPYEEYFEFLCECGCYFTEVQQIEFVRKVQLYDIPLSFFQQKFKKFAYDADKNLSASIVDYFIVCYYQRRVDIYDPVMGYSLLAVAFGSGLSDYCESYVQ